MGNIKPEKIRRIREARAEYERSTQQMEVDKKFELAQILKLKDDTVDKIWDEWEVPVAPVEREETAPVERRNGHVG